VRTRRLLVDLRETAKLRGFHLGSALRIAATELDGVDIWYLGGERPDERLAIHALAFDAGLRLRRWRRPVVASGPRVDLYVAVAERIPRDKIALKARKAARRCLVGLLFSDPLPAPAIEIVPANDIVVFAREICARIARGTEGAGETNAC
jgi:hypothetical protein